MLSNSTDVYMLIDDLLVSHWNSKTVLLTAWSSLTALTAVDLMAVNPVMIKHSAWQPFSFRAQFESIKEKKEKQCWLLLPKNDVLSFCAIITVIADALGHIADALGHVD